MSIKKLFDAQSEAKRNYLSETTERDAFEQVESGRNIRAIEEKQLSYEPEVDFSNPSNFAVYGSAYLYYKSAIERIIDYYPYDGSSAELNEFYNYSLDIDKYLFNNLYPRTNGYVKISSDGWGSTSVAPDVANKYFGIPTTKEHITFKGGPGTGSLGTFSLSSLSNNPYSDAFKYANVYDTTPYITEGLPTNYGSGARQSNLRCDFDTGVTVEFWLTTGSANTINDNTQTRRKVIFDMWNNVTCSSPDYARMTIALDDSAASGGGSPFIFTVLSGTLTDGNTQKGIQLREIGPPPGVLHPAGITVADLSVWNHYALTFQNSGSYFLTSLYFNGNLVETVKDPIGGSKAGPMPQFNEKGMMGRIGALLTEISGTHLAYSQDGAGKLSGSIDEFRFWKVARTPQQISENWFKQVRGGVNSDISNIDLGMYYKFNEGITGDASIDSKVLDFGGRLCNGVWTGYPGSNARSTDSAIILAGQATSEYKDPIIYATHPDVVSLKDGLLDKGSYHDAKSNTTILSMIPSWIIEEDESNANLNNRNSVDESNLRKMSHIVGVYFDKIRLYIDALPSFKQPSYPTASASPIPFARHLPQSLGLVTPDIFVDSSVIERFYNLTTTGSFEGSLVDTKNLIYTNLYNGLANIYKAKGTEKAIKNIFRSFYIDEDLVKLNVYANNTVYTLNNNLQQTLVKRRVINHNNSANQNGVVYQAVSGTATSNGDALGYISGSLGEGITESGYGFEDLYGFTAEADVIFPTYFTMTDVVDRNYASSSLFGIHTVNTASAHVLAGTVTQIQNPDPANFQIYAIRTSQRSKDVYFQLSSSLHPDPTTNLPIGVGSPFPTLTSSVFPSVYTNEVWNFSVRLKPIPYTSAPDSEVIPGVVTGSTDYTYKLIFRGVNADLGVIQNSFVLTSSIDATTAKNFLRAHKRIYAGARRVNMTGGLMNPTDVHIAGVRYWAKSLDDESLDQHGLDIDNYGISGSYWPLSPLDYNRTGSARFGGQSNILNNKTIVLNWNFNNVTSSDATGQFDVVDISSGSALLRDNFGWLGNLAGYQHTGYGYGFGTSSSDVQVQQPVNTYKFIDPEIVVASDMINLVDDKELVYYNYGNLAQIPSYYYVLEKSMYNAISEEMLKFFAGVVDFQSIIGAPINRYRERYKDLEKLREIFFRKVTKTSNVDKYITYYRWFDDALAEIIAQFVPASSDFVPDVYNTIESHVLERPKYQSKFPTVEYFYEEPEGQIAGPSIVPGLIETPQDNWESNGTTADQDNPGASTDINVIRAIEPMLGPGYDSSEWSTISNPSGRSTSRPTDKSANFWKVRAKRSAPEITSNDPLIDAYREKYRQVAASAPFLTSSTIHPPTLSTYNVATNTRTFYQASQEWVRNYRVRQKLTIKAGRSVKQGANTGYNNHDFARNSLRPAGPVNTDGGVYIPENVLVGFIKDIKALPEYYYSQAAPYKKTRRYMKVNHGRNYEDGLGYMTQKSSRVFPFSLYTPPIENPVVNEGAGKFISDMIETSSLEITNLHQDSYGDFNEIPLQGPFTDRFVGGNQHRHIPFNKGADDFWYNRPEAWKILLGTCPVGSLGLSGAIGMAGVDYPWPEANEEGVRPYPMTGSPPAIHYRDYISKRPLNIKNILMITGSEDIRVSGVIAQGPIGNYSYNYEVVSTVGTYTNSRAFIKQQPQLPPEVISTTIPLVARPGPTNVRTFLNVHRRDAFVSEYNVGYLSGAGTKSIIRGTFAAPGSITTMGAGYLDFRGSEYSPYNALPWRHLDVIGPSQVPSGTFSEPTGIATPGIRIYDLHGKDFGLRALTARHASRFGTDSVFATGSNAPGTVGSENYPSFYKVNRNTLVRMVMTNDGDIFNPSSVLAVTGAFYDNASVSYQIPRSTRQYQWVSGCITGSDIRFYGYVGDGWYSGSDGYVSYYDWVSGSQFDQTRGNYQGPILNIYTIDPLSTTETNVIGNSEQIENYINNEYATKIEATSMISGAMFNALATRRGYTFGWSWRLGRTQYNPLLRNEVNTSKITVQQMGAISPTSYNLPPASFKGRCGYVNIGDTDKSLSVKLTNTNEKIYFNDLGMNNLAFENIEIPSTPLEKFVKNPPSPINWVWTIQNIFPSTRNEMLSGTVRRVGYNNNFWRQNLSDRVAVGDTFNTSFNIDASQSCWSLDAPEDFLTRTGLPNLAPDTNANRKVKAGELQNSFVQCHSGVVGIAAQTRGLSPGALYARKHCVTAFTSVVAGSGMPINQTGTIPAGTEPFQTAYQLDWGGGESLWEAGSQACVVSKTSDGYTLERLSSEPWYNSYSDFRNSDLKFQRGYSVIPEFRISEHIEEMIRQGINNYTDKVDMYSIPETGLNSTSKTFWIDYSNSDMCDYLGISCLNDLEGREIRLSCDVVKKFNPYKGFYPHQRTIDLVEQLSASYGNSFNSEIRVGATITNFVGEEAIQIEGGSLRPILQPLCAPGILYNSIKSGMAVDYPVLFEANKISGSFYAGANQGQTDNIAIAPLSGISGSEFWDYRVPFEAIISPQTYLGNKVLVDIEPHFMVHQRVSGTLTDQAIDPLYSMMASNFFGEVGNFFLKDSEYTKISSRVVADTLSVDTKATYGMRIKLRPSLSGTKTYNHESGSDGTNKGYGRFGGQYYNGQAYITSSEFPLPQYPISNNNCKQNFTLYSRPTAFFPPVAGQPAGTDTVQAAVVKTQPKDFSRGVNCGTPPYFDGEAWCDIIFKPTSNQVTLDQVLTEASSAYWRFDPGTEAVPQLIASFPESAHSGSPEYILSGYHINSNVMQLSASILTRGIEQVNTQEKDKWGNEIKEINTIAGQRWVIQPKFETPHMNFSDQSLHPITAEAGNLTLPIYASGAVSRGMWHQFGIMEPDQTKGIFLEITDIPTPWLRYHYDVRNTNSIYNNFNAAANGAATYKNMKSLLNLVGFENDETSKRLGEVKDELVLHEAIVAIPYIVETLATGTDQDTVNKSDRKQFIDIPPQRVSAAMKSQKGSLKGDSLDAAGESIRKLVQKMDRYVLPPQVDWLNNNALDPFVMYIFEFDYTLDRDDLSYIYQGLAPRQTGDYKKMRLQRSSIAHELLDTELLRAENLMDENQLRWMLFKVKQRSQADYYDFVPTQAGQASAQSFTYTDKETGYTIGYNWPYDYLSLIELVKMDVEVLMKPVVVPTDGDDIFMPNPNDGVPISKGSAGFAESVENKFAESAENKGLSRFAESAENKGLARRRTTTVRRNKQTNNRSSTNSRRTNLKKGGSNY